MSSSGGLTCWASWLSTWRSLTCFSHILMLPRYATLLFTCREMQMTYSGIAEILLRMLYQELQVSAELGNLCVIQGVATYHLRPNFVRLSAACMQALALLMRGNGTRSFLEPKPLSDACEDLLPLLEHGVQARASPHIPCSPRCRTAQQRQRAEALALAVISVLDLSLFSAAVLGLPAGLRHPALWLLCAVFRLACLLESCAQGVSEDLSELQRPGKLPGLPVHVVWLEGQLSGAWHHAMQAHIPGCTSHGDRLVCAHFEACWMTDLIYARTVLCRDKVCRLGMQRAEGGCARCLGRWPAARRPSGSGLTGLQVPDAGDPSACAAGSHEVPDS